MALVGILMIALGGSIAWLLGVRGLDPQTAIDHVGELFTKAKPENQPKAPTDRRNDQGRSQ